jgi:hypothetical protein
VSDLSLEDYVFHARFDSTSEPPSQEASASAVPEEVHTGRKDSQKSEWVD